RRRSGGAQRLLRPGLHDPEHRAGPAARGRSPAAAPDLEEGREMMRAYILTDQGPALQEAPKVAPRQGQVSVKVMANALNRVDLAMATGALHGARGGVGTVL